VNQQATLPTSNCAELEALIPDYVLGILDEEERERVKRGLADCPQLAPQVASYKALHERMLFSAPLHQPEAALKGRILQAARASRSPATARARWAYAAAALLLVLLGATNLYWMVENGRLRAAAVTTDRSRVNRLATGALTRVDLTSSQSSPLTTAALSWVPIVANEQWIVWFVAQDLAPLPANSAYQLWLLRENEPALRVGRFVSNADGSGAFVFEIAEPLRSFDQVLVTREMDPDATEPAGETILIADL
jgi:anti-sigma factor RsiW